MKILASIPVEKISLTAHTYTFRSEEMELEVVRVLRNRADSTRNRYYYQADVKRPLRMHPEASPYNPDGSAYTAETALTRVSIIRARNPKWKPPPFPDGKDALEIG